MMNSTRDQKSELGSRIAKLAAELTVGEHALVTAIGDFEESGQWAREGAISCAQWLSWRIGMSPEASRERVRVAKALRALPRIDDAFRVAKLSYSKVRAVTRVATPANEEFLVEVARASTAAQLESICRKFRSCLSDEPGEAEARRRMSVRATERGTLRVSIELPSDEGARFMAAVESGRAASSSHAREGSEAPRITRVDGLMMVVESWFADGPKPRRGGAPHEVVLHVSPEALNVESESLTAAPPGPSVSAETSRAPLEHGRFARDAGTSLGTVPIGQPLIEPSRSLEHLAPFIDVAGGVGVSAETARRVCCDAGIVVMLEDGDGKVLDVGRKRRTVPAALARALEAREGRVCSFPGCSHTMFVEKHHIQHWADGGATSLANLCQLCRFHHTFVHEHGWRVERTEAGLKFTTPRGRVVAPVPELPPPPDGALQARAANAGIELDEVSLQTEGWCDPVDYVQVIDALLRETLVERSAVKQAAATSAHAVADSSRLPAPPALR